MITYLWNETCQMSMPKLIKVIIPIEHRIYGNGKIYDWLKANCQHPYYIMPSWNANGVEFEDDEDAFLFALRWS